MKTYIQLFGWAVAALFVASCSEKSEQAASAETAEVVEKIKVKVASVEAREVDQIGEYTATVQSDVKNNISSNSPLRIEKIYAEVGDRVTKGQVLVQMDASNLRQLELQIANQEIDFKRTDELYKVGGVSKAEWDNARTQLDVNKTALANMVVNTRLTSPINGVVTARHFDEGDMSGGAAILTVETLSPVKMQINISEMYFPKVKKGMPVTVTLDTYGDEEFQGRVSIVYPTIDPVTHTFPVEITLANSDSRVRPGMFARATIVFGTELHTVVPDLAVVKQMGSGDHYVYVYHPENGTVSHTKVEVGRRLDDEYELNSGVPSGAQVVVAGQTRLADGVAVEVVK